MDLYLRAALGLLGLGVGTGALLRWSQLSPLEGLHFGHALHAHSHTLYFGWAGLALFTLFFERVGATGRAARGVLGALVLLGLATFAVFLHSGYSRPGIVLAAASVVPFGAAVGVVLRGLRRVRGPDVPFLRAAVAWVLVSYVAAISRVVVKVAGVTDPVWAGLAVHLFLGAFGAFFVLGVMGLFVRALGATPAPELRLVLGLGAPLLAWPAALVVPDLEATPLAGLARASSVVLLVPATVWLRWLWRTSAPRAPLERAVLRSTAVAWLLTVAGSALLGVGLLREFVLQRSTVVLGIHLVVLGVVTGGLLLLLEGRRAAPAFHAVSAHQLALAVMLLGLGLVPWWPQPGLVLALVGGVLVIAAQAWATARFFGATRAPAMRTGAALLLGGLVGCTPPASPPPPTHEAPAALQACAALAAPVPTIEAAVTQLNRLPEDAGVPCFVASLPRPLVATATTGIVSAQPAGGPKSPRVFLLSDTLVLSVVPEGNGAKLIEFGEWVTPRLTLKAEVELPRTAPLTPRDPFERVKHQPTTTTCGLCHRDEAPHATVPDAYVSEAYRPHASTVVHFDALAAEHQACIDAADESERCAMFHALFDFGAFTEGAFDAAVSTFP